MNTNGNNFKVAFFIDETDQGVGKLAKNFHRTKTIEEIQPKWRKIRLGIKQFVRDQRRKAQKTKKNTRMTQTTAPTNLGVGEKSKSATSDVKAKKK
uniref:Uncharacterized protein n=1 Tax=Setaria digitata TaxID=48799 RepID=A0A915Q6W0_9BILA